MSGSNAPNATPTCIAGQSGADCQSCHTVLGWKVSVNVVRQHHRGGAGAVFAGLNTDCASCHARDFQAAKAVDHQAVRFSTNCQSCHNLDRWTGAQFGLRRFDGPMECAPRHAIQEGPVTREKGKPRPVINATLRIGCGSCVDACPETEPLALQGGKAILAHPDGCAGHLLPRYESKPDSPKPARLAFARLRPGERKAIADALPALPRNQSRAAALPGIGRFGLRYRMKKLGLL